MKTVSNACLACVLLATLLPARAADNTGSSAMTGLSDQRLEQLYWDCDRMATQTALPLDTGALCAMAGDELKRRRFDGDFERMLAWWRANKEEQHERVSASQAMLE